MDDHFSRRFTIAASHAAPFLTGAVAHHIRNKFDRSAGFDIGTAIKWNLPLDAFTRSDLDGPPRSIDDFLFSTRQVFSSDVSEAIRSRAGAFDESVGIQGLADALIGLRPMEESMFDVIDSIACLFEVAADEAAPLPSLQEWASQSVPSTESRTNQLGNGEDHPTFEGLSMGALGANAEPCPVV